MRVLLSMMLVLVGAQAQAAELKVKGFLDPQAYYQSYNSASTFLLNDGALYVSKQFGLGRAMLDIAVQGQAVDLGIGVNQAQAYVEYRYENGIQWKLGKWDSLLGWEAKDTLDLIFARHSLIHQNNPITHTGYSLGYNLLGPFSLDFFIANQREAGLLLGGTPDWGGALKVDIEVFRVGFGAVVEKGNPSCTGSSTSCTTMDVALGVTYEDHAFDLEANLLSRNNDQGGGQIYMLTYDSPLAAMIAEDLGAAIRVEWARNAFNPVVATRNTLQPGKRYTELRATLGLRFAMTKDLTPKLDYTYQSYADEPDADTGVGHTTALSMVYKF